MGYSIQWEINGVVKRYFGQVTAAEMVDSVVATESDARFDRLRYVINDFLDVQGMAVTQQDIDLVAAHDVGASMSNSHIKIAMITSESEVIALVRRYLHAAGHVFPTRVFPTIAEARAWLQMSNA